MSRHGAERGLRVALALGLVDVALMGWAASGSNSLTILADWLKECADALSVLMSWITYRLVRGRRRVHRRERVPIVEATQVVHAIEHGGHGGVDGGPAPARGDAQSSLISLSSGLAEAASLRRAASSRNAPRISCAG